MKVIVVGSFANSLINFRGHLLQAMINAGHQVHACAPRASDEVKSKLKDMGVTYHDISLSRAATNPLQDIRYFLYLRALFKRLKPDVVFAYTIKPVIYGSLAAKVCKVPNIFSLITGLGYTFTDVEKRYYLHLWVRYLYKIALRHNKTVFFQNNDDRSIFTDLCILKKDTHTQVTNGSGVDLSYFSKAPLPEQPVAFLMIARLLKDKGVIEYVTAATELKKRYPNTVFHLVGFIDPNPSGIHLTQLKEWQDAGTIIYHGETNDVRPYIAKASVYVLPSYREGMPRSVLEAMAMGRPIVTTDAPGCRETIVDGHNGFLVPIKNSIALTQALERFIINPSLIATMGHHSRELAEQRFDVHNINRNMMRSMSLLHEETV